MARGKKSGRAAFTEASAKRIARAVINAEGGNRNMGPTTFATAGGDDAIVRGTFAAPWAKDATATVTDATLSAVTYQVKNYLGSTGGTGTKPCTIAWASGEWILVAVETSSDIKKGTYTPPWDKGNTKSVTVGSSTYTATNYANSIGYTGSDRDCLITQVGSEWVLINTDTTQVIRGQFTAPWVKYTSIAVTAIDGQVYQAYNPYGTAYYNTYGGENTRQCAIAYVQYGSGYRWEAIAMECTA